MTPDQALEASNILAAYARGEAIQFRYRGERGWLDVPANATPCFTFHQFEYRIKPKLEELFITVQGSLEEALEDGHNQNGGKTAFIGSTYRVAATAFRHVDDWCTGTPSRVFKVSEVFPE